MKTRTSSPPQDELITTQEVARLTGAKESTVVSWRTEARAQGLPFLKIGRLVRYRRADVLSFIESGRCNPAKD